MNIVDEYSRRDKNVITQRDVPTIEDYAIWDEENDYCKVVIRIAVI